MSDEKLLTVEQVAERFSVSERTVHRLVKAGRLPAIRLSRKMLRFRPSDVEAFITAHEVRGADLESEDES